MAKTFTDLASLGKTVWLDKFAASFSYVSLTRVGRYWLSQPLLVFPLWGVVCLLKPSLCLSFWSFSRFRWNSRGQIPHPVSAGPCITLIISVPLWLITLCSLSTHCYFIWVLVLQFSCENPVGILISFPPYVHREVYVQSPSCIPYSPTRSPLP